MKGIVFTYEYIEGELHELFEQQLKENPDFVYYGCYDNVEAIEEELLYQGLTLEQIAEYNLNTYGHCIEVLEDEQGLYHLYIGAR